MGYITNFIVYTLAMVGVIVVALLVFKNATSIGGGRTSKYLKIIDSISLGQRKNLYIVSTGREQFLIAGDVNNTNLISKLDGITLPEQKVAEPTLATKSEGGTFKEIMDTLPKKSYMDRSNIGITSSLVSGKTNNSVIKNLAEIMRNK